MTDRVGAVEAMGAAGRTPPALAGWPLIGNLVGFVRNPNPAAAGGLPQAPGPSSGCGAGAAVHGVRAGPEADAGR